MGVTADQVANAIRHKMELIPEEINMNKYKTKEAQVARRSCSEKLYVNFGSLSTLFIYLEKYLIEMALNLMKCKRCQLLGHTVNHFPHNDEEVAEWAACARKKEATCADCLMHNQGIEKRKGSKILIVDSNHLTRNLDCPIILQRQMKKYFQVRN